VGVNRFSGFKARVETVATVLHLSPVQNTPLKRLRILRYDMQTIQPSLRDLCNSGFFPALKRRAILTCPSAGTKGLRIPKCIGVTEGKECFAKHVALPLSS
jgi:hypothetical protein